MLLRRAQIGAGTTDQRLLDSRGPSDWVHTDPWRVLRIQAEFVEGFGALAEVPRAVTVFGSARTPRDHPEYQLGRELGAALAANGFAVITGGGPGAMEAANRGCKEADGLSIGLGIELPFEQGLNDWVDLGINFRYFFARKTMFVKYSQAFVCLPGRVLGVVVRGARGTEHGDGGRQLGEQAEALDELALDAQHPPRVGVHPVRRAALVEQPLVRGAGLDLSAAQ